MMEELEGMWLDFTLIEKDKDCVEIEKFKVRMIQWKGRTSWLGDI